MSRRRRSTGNILLEIFVAIIKFYCFLFGLIIRYVIPFVFNIVRWILCVMIPSVVYLVWSMIGYSKSEYKAVTHNSLWDTYTDKGRLGEYLIYRHLRKQSGDAKWLFNLYIPREDDRTTEIDVLMLHTSGIYVFESKNYSGWIFGSYYRDEWTQCIKRDEEYRARKYRFYNPVKQNELHVKWLSKLLPEEVHNLIRPVVVFGNRCRLKNLNLEKCNQPVIKLKKLRKEFTKIMSIKNIDDDILSKVYQALYEYSQVGWDIKEKHVQNIEKIKTGIKDNHISETLNDECGEEEFKIIETGEIDNKISEIEKVKDDALLDESIESEETEEIPLNTLGVYDKDDYTKLNLSVIDEEF